MGDVLNPGIGDTGSLNDVELSQISGGAMQGKLAQHTVEKNETLFYLANMYGCTIDEIMAINTFIPNRNALQVGWVLSIPDNR